MARKRRRFLFRLSWIKSVICDACVGWAGAWEFAGHAVNPAPRSGPAAGGCAFSRMRGNASQAMRLHPWRLVGALLVCAVLHKRQDRGWASCPTRPAHAPDPWRPTVPKTPTPPPSTHSCRAQKRRQLQLPFACVCLKQLLFNPVRDLLHKQRSGSKSIQMKSGFPMATSPLSGVGRCGFAGPLGAMDGAHEPPGMDLRRVPRTHIAPPSHGQAETGLAWLWLRLRLRT